MIKYPVKYEDPDTPNKFIETFLYPEYTEVTIKGEEKYTFIVTTEAVPNESWMAERSDDRTKCTLFYEADILRVNNDSIKKTPPLSQETFESLEQEIQEIDLESEQALLAKKFAEFHKDTLKFEEETSEVLKEKKGSRRTAPIPASKAFKKKKEKFPPTLPNDNKKSLKELVVEKAEKDKGTEFNMSELIANSTNIKLDAASKSVIKALLDIAVTSLKEKIDNN